LDLFQGHSLLNRLNQACPLSTDETIATLVNIPGEVSPLLVVVKSTIGAELLTLVLAWNIGNQVARSDHAALGLPHPTALPLLLPTVKARFRTSITGTIALLAGEAVIVGVEEGLARVIACLKEVPQRQISTDQVAILMLSRCMKE